MPWEKWPPLVWLKLKYDDADSLIPNILLRKAWLKIGLLVDFSLGLIRISYTNIPKLFYVKSLTLFWLEVFFTAIKI